jgi:hypothetical protein
MLKGAKMREWWLNFRMRLFLWAWGILLGRSYPCVDIYCPGGEDCNAHALIFANSEETIKKIVSGATRCEHPNPHLKV